MSPLHHISWRCSEMVWPWRARISSIPTDVVARARVPKKSRTTARARIGGSSRLSSVARSRSLRGVETPVVSPVGLRSQFVRPGSTDLPRLPRRVQMSTSFEMPRLRTLARHALPKLLETTVIPLALFAGVLHTFGLWGAIVAGLGWSYAAILRRLVTRQRIPGLLLIGTLTLTARSVLAFATGSSVLYFLQPTLGTAMVAVAFLLSVVLGRPLAQRIAAELLPDPRPRDGRRARAPLLPRHLAAVGGDVSCQRIGGGVAAVQPVSRDVRGD